MANRLLGGAVLALTLTLCGCPGDSKKKMADKQKQLEQAKADQKAKQEQKELLPDLPKDVVRLDKPWEDESYVELKTDAKCPENFWALFNGEVPGATPEEKKANKARQAEYAKALREQTYIIKLRAPDQVSLKPYDAPNGKFPLEVVGTIDCTDSIGHVAIAWTAAKAGDPGASAAKEGSDLVQNAWIAPPLTFALPMAGMSAAKEFDNKHRLGLSARLIVKLGKTEIDKKLKKLPKVVEKAAGETLTIGGGTEDWGAGRLVRVEQQALRIAIEREKTALIEKKN